MGYLTTKNRYLTVGKNQIAYRMIGKQSAGLPLVMLTHLAATLDEWDPKLLDLLAKDRQVVVLDLPGVGASQGKVGATISQMASQALAIIQALGFSKINLLGLSMGGMIAQELVKLKPSLVNRLVLAGTAPRGGKEVELVTRKTFAHMAKGLVNRVDPKRYIFYNHDQKGGQAALKVLKRMKARPAVAKDKPIKISSFLSQLKAIKRFGIAPAEDLNFITQKTLIVNGDNDLEVLTANSYELQAKIKNSRLLIYPNAGHGSIFQFADEFAKELEDFLAN